MRDTIVVVQPDLDRRTAWANGLGAWYHVVRCDTADQAVFAATQVTALAIVAEVSTPAELEILLGGDHGAHLPTVLVATTTTPINVRYASAVAVHVARPPVAVLARSLRELLAGASRGEDGPCQLPFRMPPERIAKWRTWLPTGNSTVARRTRQDTQPAPWLGAMAAHLTGPI